MAVGLMINRGSFCIVRSHNLVLSWEICNEKVDVRIWVRLARVARSAPMQSVMVDCLPEGFKQALLDLLILRHQWVTCYY
jgi:hypothetical protein